MGLAETLVTFVTFCSERYWELRLRGPHVCDQEEEFEQKEAKEAKVLVQGMLRRSR